MLALTYKCLEAVREGAFLLSVLSLAELQVLCEVLTFLRESSLKVLRPACLLRQLLGQTVEAILDGLRDGRLLLAQE